MPTASAPSSPPRLQGLAALAGRPRERAFLLWAAALLLVCVLGLWRTPLFDVDEGAFGEASREMLASGDWGHTTLNGNDRFDKPILVYWLQAASLAVFGVNEFALRLPSAVCTWLWALALALFARERLGQGEGLGERSGLLAGAMVATSLGVLLIGRAATADALLNLLITLATLDLWRWAEVAGQPAGDPGRVRQLAQKARQAPQGEARITELFVSAASQPAALAAPLLRRAALWIGLGLLAKGPVAVLVPGAALFLALAFAKRWRLMLDALRDPWAWAILLAVATPWYAYALMRHGRAFIDGFFVKHNLARYAGALEGHGGGLAYYLVVLPLLLLPWSALLGPMVWSPVKLWREPLPRFLLLWLLFVLVFFSFSGTKLPHYLLYGFSPVVLLAARGLAALDVRGPRLRLAHGGAPASAASAVAAPAFAALRGPGAPMVIALLASFGLLLLLGALLPLALPRIAAGQSDALYRTLLGTPVPLADLALDLWLGLGLAAAFIVAVMAWPREQLALPAWTGLAALRLTHSTRVALAGVATMLALAWFVVPWWGQRLQAPVKTAALKARGWLGEPTPAAAAGSTSARQVVQWRLHQPSFAVYLGQPTPLRPPRPGELALVRLDRLPPADAAAWQLVHAERGYGLLLWTGAQPAPDQP